MSSVLIRKFRKVANCVQKILPAFCALYASGCHIGDRFDAAIEAGELRAPILRSNLSGFLDKLALSGIEPVSVRDTHIGGIYGFSIIRDLRFPNIQERYHGSFTALLAASFGEEVRDKRATNASTNASAKKAHNYRYYVWHLIAGLLVGCSEGVLGRWRIYPGQGKLIYRGSWRFVERKPKGP